MFICRKYSFWSIERMKQDYATGAACMLNKLHNTMQNKSSSFIQNKQIGFLKNITQQDVFALTKFKA